MQNFAWFFKKPSKDWIKIWLLSTARVVTGVHCQHVPHVARQPIHTHMQNPFAPHYSCQGDISQTAFGTVPVSLHCQFWDTKQIVNQTPRFPSDSNRNALISSLLEQSESSKASQCRPGRLEDWKTVERRSTHHTATILPILTILTSQRNSCLDSNWISLLLPSCTESMPSCFDADRLRPGQRPRGIFKDKKCKRHERHWDTRPQILEDVRRWGISSPKVWTLG